MGNIENTYIDQFKVKNLTNRTVTLGDLVNFSVGPHKTIDLLKVPRITKEKINQSVHLAQAIDTRILRVIKPKKKHLSSQKKEMIIPDFEDIPKEAEIINTKGVHISSPTASEEIPIWLTDMDIQINEITAITDSGTVTINLEHRAATTPYTPGTSIPNASIIADANGQSQTGFTDRNVIVDRWIVLTSSAINGATKLNVNISYSPL